MTNSAGTWTTLLFFLRRHWVVYSMMGLFGLTVGLLEAANLAVFLPIMSTLVGATGTIAPESALALAISGVVDNIPVADPFVAACSLFLILTLVKGGFSLFYEYYVARVSGDILFEYRQELLGVYRRMPLSRYETESVGNLIYNLGTPPVMLAHMLYVIPRAAVDLFRLCSVVLLLFLVEPQVTLALIVLGVFMQFLISRPLSRRAYRLSHRRRTAEESMTGIATEWVSGVRPIRMADADDHWTRAYESECDTAREALVFSNLLLASPRHVFEILAFTLLLAAIMGSWIASPEQFREHVATLAFFALGLTRTLPSLAALARAPIDLRHAMPDVEHVYKRLQEAREHHGGRQGERPFPGVREEISVDRASVRYEGQQHALADVSIRIPRGTSLAVVGASGAGKTTLMNVILGIVTTTSGRVTFDGVPVGEIEQSGLFRKTGFVGQKVVLFRGTVAENIAFFRPEVSREQVIRAARTAEIHDFISSLPRGYDTDIGEAGARLSGGQAQRLALARAIVEDPCLIVLDEVTSALDLVSERSVMHSLQNAARGRTVVIVTHRLHTIPWVDQICVLDAGRVAEIGTWHQLSTRPGGRLRELIRAQQHGGTEAGPPASAESEAGDGLMSGG